MAFLSIVANRARRIAAVLTIMLAFTIIYTVLFDDATRDLGGIGMSRFREERHSKYSVDRIVTMMYFSVGNTITMGYGDIFAQSLKAKLLVIAQISCTLFVVLV